jgi:hypothetical protein
MEQGAGRVRSIALLDGGASRWSASGQLEWRGLAKALIALGDKVGRGP